MDKEKTTLIDQYSKKSGFEVPENYFEDFASQFEQQHLSTTRVVWNRWRSWVYAAAVFTGIFLVGFGFVYMQDTIEEKNMEYLASDLYIDTVIQELSEEELIEVILANNDLYSND